MGINKGGVRTMTSKEAFEHIIFDAKMEKPIFSMYYQEFLKPIEKDLEVLNILKKHIYSSDSSISIILDDLRNYDDFQKIKGWLENEQ